MRIKGAVTNGSRAWPPPSTFAAVFSKACEYAFRAMVLIAAGSADGGRLTVQDVAKGTGTPPAFAAKILQKLARARLLHSLKGPGGGYELGPALARKVKLSDVVKAIDDDSVYKGCALGLTECSNRNPCPLHDRFIAVREDLQRMLEGTSIQDLTEGFDPRKPLRLR